MGSNEEVVQRSDGVEDGEGKGVRMAPHCWEKTVICRKSLGLGYYQTIAELCDQAV